MNARVELILCSVEELGVSAQLYDDAAARVEQQSTLLAAQQRLWGDFTLHPCHASHELFRHGGRPTTGAGELAVESIVGPLCRDKFILVPLDGFTSRVGVELLNSTPTPNEFFQTHHERVA